MYRKVTSIFLSLIILVSFMPAFAFAGDNVDENNNENVADIVDAGECGKDGNNVTWTMYSDGTLAINGTGEMRDYVFDNSNQKLAPWRNYEIKHISIDEGITKIGSWAFAHYAGEQIELPDSLLYIGDSAFVWSGLTEIHFPQELLSIGDSAFSNTGIKQVTFPEGLQSIGRAAFPPIYQEEIRLPSSIQYVGTMESHVDTFIIPDDIYYRADIKGCISHETSIKKLLIPVHAANSFENHAPGAAIEEIQFTGTGELVNNMPSNNASLKKVVLPEGVTKLSMCFMECSGLESINIPNSMEIIHAGTFEGCSSLKNIDVPCKVKLIDSDGNTVEQFYSCDATITRTHDCAEGFALDVAPTCTESGTQTKHCKNCGAVLELQEIPAQGHAYGEWMTAKEPTCISKGLKESICEKCGDKRTEELPLIEHIWKTDYTIDKSPTCEDDGAQSIHCSICDAIKEDSAQSIQPKGHIYGDWTTTKEPTVDEEGVREHTCSVCGDTKSEAIPKIPLQQAADEAITVAEVARITAETAAADADRAQKAADEAAKTPGDAAIAAAEAAKTVAEAAKEAAEAYKEAAEKADQLADMAIEQADTDVAKAAANTAKGKSSALVTGAKAAVSNAATAVQTAIDSITSAENAKSDADRAAQESARQAQEQAAAAALFASLGNAYEDPSLPRVSIKAPKKAKKAFTPRWKKLSKKNQKKITKIEYEYSMDPNFASGNVFRTASKKSAGGKKIKGPSNTTYYVRAHTYVYRNGVKYVSPWSKTKKVKTK